MGEIININVGKAGIRIGQKFLESIAKEHFQDKQENRGKNYVFFNQTSKNNNESRSLFLDLHSSSIQKINLKTNDFTIPQTNLIKGSKGNGDLCPTSRNIEGCQILSQSFDKVRKQVQKCDLLSGFLLINSIAGGTGGGMTAGMVNHLKDFYPSNILEDHIVIPECNSACSPLHIYNTVLYINTLIEQTDICFFAQNSAFDKRLLLEGNLRPTLDEINAVNAQNICQTSAPYRFGGSLNTNQRKICVNMVMFPRMKFMISAFSNKKVKINHIENCLKTINYSKSDFFLQNSGSSDIFSVHVNCRDNFVYQSQVDEKVNKWLSDSKLETTQWIVNQKHLSITEPGYATSPSSSMVINSRHVVKIFQNWSNIFTAMFRRRAFYCHYQNIGSDEMEFTQAESGLNDIISQYTPNTGYFEEQEFPFSETIQQ